MRTPLWFRQVPLALLCACSAPSCPTPSQVAGVVDVATITGFWRKNGLVNCILHSE
jgi:hypothetical protein